MSWIRSGTGVDGHCSNLSWVLTRARLPVTGVSRVPAVPPPGAVPQTVDLQGGWTGVRWLDPTGLPARMESPAWTQGQPAPFDPPHLATVRIAIGRFLRDRGYFAAAKLLEEQKSAGRSARTAAASAPAVPPPVDLAVRSGPDGAVLVIAFRELSPPAVLTGCEVLPGCRTTAADLQQTLGIVPGSVVTEQDRLAWREALRQGGQMLAAFGQH